MIKFVRETSPYIRKNVTVKRMMIDVLIALIPVVFASIFFFGLSAITTILISTFVMVGTEAIYFGICHLPNRKEKNIKFFSKENFQLAFETFSINNLLTPVISAIIFAMLLPSQTDIYIIIVGAFIGIFFGKLVYGGIGKNIFNPAAVGRIAIGLSFGNRLAYVDTVGGGTPLQQIKDSLIDLSTVLNNYSFRDLILGNIPGSMGEISALAIILGGIYLVIRSSADFRAIISMIISFMVMMFLVGIATPKVHALEFMLFQVLSGGLLFGAIYMITDPVTSPTNKPGRIIYGGLAGILVALIRIFGAFPEGVAFSILLMNMFVPVIEYHKWSNTKYTKNWYIFVGSIIILFGLLFLLGV